MGGPDLVIFSERVVLGTGIGPAAVRVRDGVIAEVSPGVAASGAATVDLGPVALMPGVVDSHVHINEPGRTEWEGFATAGRAAAAGGVTSMVVMPLNCDPVATSVSALMGEARAAAGVCGVDYGFWGGVVPGNAGELAALWGAGVLGFKCFLVHSGIDEFANTTEVDLNAAMPILARLMQGGAPLLVHAEDPGAIEAAQVAARLQDEPRSYRRYLASRPPRAESVAVEMMVRLLRRHRGRVHIVHVAAVEALEVVRAAKREGLMLTAETCPHYLSLTAEEIADGATIFKCAPPIRERAVREALWSGLRDSALDLIASDHSPCPPELKLMPEGDFAGAWGGISSLQLALPVVWTEASRRGFTLADVARWMCRGPARLAGLEGMKGGITPGCDADLVAFDPGAEFVVGGAELEHRHKATPYDGRMLRGVVLRTWLRGRVVFDAERGRDAGRFGEGVHGRWLKRTETNRS
ncbi:MAG: allantoinase AllB [Phycisphaerales bacterium]